LKSDKYLHKFYQGKRITTTLSLFSLLFLSLSQNTNAKRTEQNKVHFARGKRLDRYLSNRFIDIYFSKEPLLLQRGSSKALLIMMMMMRKTFVSFLVLVLALSFCFAHDEELDVSNEISENTRNLVFGIKCGCCKAVTAEIGIQFKEILLETTQKTRGGEEEESKTVFRSKYVGQFNEKLQIALDRMCRPPPTATSSKRAIEKSASAAKRWRYSQSGAKAIQNSMLHINTLGQNATDDDLKEIERVMLGIQLFTNDVNKQYVNPDPKVAENSGGTNLMADSYVTGELLDACNRIAESLELEDQLDEAKKNGEFGINEQHKTCLDLDYCKVRQGGAKKKDTRTRSQKDKDEAYERMKKLFVSKEDMEEFEKNNPQMKDDDSVDPLEETLDSPSPKKRKEKNDDETKEATKSDFTDESGDESLFASVKRKFNEYLRRYKVGQNRLQKLRRQSGKATTTSENIEGEL
tara:strand:+ start:1393 stop:2784 length:1392 start_codon:yes stop_codon:yes gene_type:complete